MPDHDYDLNQVAFDIANGLHGLMSREDRPFPFTGAQLTEFHDSLHTPPMSLLDLKVALNRTAIGRELKASVLQNVDDRKAKASSGDMATMAICGTVAVAAGLTLAGFMHNRISHLYTPAGQAERLEAKKTEKAAEEADRMAMRYYNPVATRPLAKARILEHLKTETYRDGTPRLTDEDRQQIDRLIDISVKKEAIGNQQVADYLWITLLIGITVFAGALAVPTRDEQLERTACKEAANFLKTSILDRGRDTTAPTLSIRRA